MFKIQKKNIYLKKNFNMNTRTERDIIKVRVHDGIVGLLYIGSIALANEYGFNYIYIALAVAILQILSPITKFCPVYTCLLYTSPSPRD